MLFFFDREKRLLEGGRCLRGGGTLRKGSCGFAGESTAGGGGGEPEPTDDNPKGRGGGRLPLEWLRFYAGALSWKKKKREQKDKKRKEYLGDGRRTFSLREVGNTQFIT